MIPPHLLNTITAGDCRELCRQIPDASIDLILTDPPYAREFLPLYSWLSAEAARVLKPGRLCVAYAPQEFLPDVIANLQAALQWHWLFDIYLPGKNARLWYKKIMCRHRPVVVFSKGPALDQRWIMDAFANTEQSKGYHPWGQSQYEAQWFVYHMTIPGAVVLEPFAGGGTVPVACRAEGRNFIAFELDPHYAEVGNTRLATVTPPLFPIDARQLDITFPD